MWDASLTAATLSASHYCLAGQQICCTVCTLIWLSSHAAFLADEHQSLTRIITGALMDALTVLTGSDTITAYGKYQVLQVIKQALNLRVSNQQPVANW